MPATLQPLDACGGSAGDPLPLSLEGTQNLGPRAPKGPGLPTAPPRLSAAHLRSLWIWSPGGVGLSWVELYELHLGTSRGLSESPCDGDGGASLTYSSRERVLSHPWGALAAGACRCGLSRDAHRESVTQEAARFQ